jgi:hypothetical protein
MSAYVVPDVIGADLNQLREILMYLRSSAKTGQPLSLAVVREQTRDALEVVDKLERDLIDIVGESVWHPEDLIILRAQDGTLYPTEFNP